MDEEQDHRCDPYQALAALQRQTQLLNAILDAEPGTVYVFDVVERRALYLNAHWAAEVGYTPADMMAMGKAIEQIFHPEDVARIRFHHRRWRRAPAGEVRRIEYRLRYKDGTWHWMVSHETPFKFDEAGRVTQILGIAHNQSRQKQAESLLLAQVDIMEWVVAQHSLSEILERLVQTLEAQAPGMLGSVLLLDEAGRLRHGAAPSLPPEFVRAVDGLPIGPKAGSCGTAIYRKAAVFVADIASDPLWEDYRSLALPLGLRACWSSPILDAQGEVLGSFALYYREPGLPTEYHRHLIHTATHLAAVAIDSRRLIDRLTASERRYRQLFDLTPEGIAVVDGELRFLEVNSCLCALLGYERDELIGRFMSQVLPHSEMDCLQNCLESSGREGNSPLECRFRNRAGIPFAAEVTAVLVDQGQRIVIIRDVTERKQVETRVQRLTQFYAALSQCNQAILHAHSMDELFPQLCQDAVEFGGMHLAWVGELDSATRCVRPVAMYGEGTAYVEGIEVSVDPELASGNGLVERAFRTRQPVWCQNFMEDPGSLFWRERSRPFGWGSCAVLPLWRAGQVAGFFVLYSRQTEIFDEAVRSLLLEMSQDISFAWDNFDLQVDRARVYRALENREAHLRTILETQPECIALLSPEGAILEINAVGLAMLELDRVEEGIGRQMVEFVSPPDRERWEELHERVMAGENGMLEFEMISARGSRRFMETHAAPLRGESGQIRAFLGISRDVTERRQSQERIHYLANYDVLTGLPNRSRLDEHLKYALQMARRSNGHLALLFIDLDRFKDVNDSLGHSEGDRVLMHVTQNMRRILREEDILSRVGGDEFILLLPSSDGHGTAQVATKLLKALASPFPTPHYDLKMTASIGVALYPEDGDNLEALARAADLAMYQAKQRGRNGFCFFTAGMQSDMVRNLHLVNALRSTLEVRGFHLVYQPLVCLATHACIGAEILLRWTDPELGVVHPAEFIPVAEESGLILPLGEWVIRSALDQLRAWIQQGKQAVPISVNVSAVQFRQADFADHLVQWSAEYGVPASLLELELTERVAMNDAQNEGAQMQRLHERGFSLSIDDFGTGYSSLSYLKRFRIHKLKIDQSFVCDITTDPEDRAIVSAIIQMARQLGFKTIAEGVETAQQLDFLRQQGCDEVQGYLIGRPMSVEDFEEFLKK